MGKRFFIYVFSLFFLLTSWIMAPPGFAQDGNNNFQLVYSDPVDDMILNSNTRDVISGSDLDQDGFYEVIVTDYSMGGQAHVFEVTADNTLEWVWSSPGTGSSSTIAAREVKVGDLDGDGFGEIILAISRSGALFPEDAGLYVYEWDGASDNGYGAVPAAVISNDPGLTAGVTEDFIIDDIDNDGRQEIININLTSSVFEDNKCYILSISGTFESSWSINTEAEYSTLNGDFEAGAYDVAVCDLDGDGLKEAVFSIVNTGKLFIVESDAPDSYTPQAYVHLDPGGTGYSLEGMAAADFDGDGADELFIVFYPHRQFVVVNSGPDVSTLNIDDHVCVLREGVGQMGMAIGDQDHGAGSDEPDIYISRFGSLDVGGYIHDFEYIGPDVCDPDSYVEHVIFQDLTPSWEAGVFQLDAPVVDLDGDGNKELLMSYTGDNPSGIQLRMFEFNINAPIITVTSPNGGEEWSAGSNQTISWTSENFIGTVNVAYSPDAGATWKELVSYLPDYGSHEWSVPYDPSTEALVRISRTSSEVPSDISNSYFTLTGASADEIEQSIERGLEWLVSMQNPDGSWGWWEQVAYTGFAVLKLEDRAFELAKNDPAIDGPFDDDYPYRFNVEEGLRYILENAHLLEIFPQAAGDPDVNGNGTGVYIANGESDSSQHASYATGIALMAVVGSRAPEIVVETGDLTGWTYGDVVQDAVDYLAFGQNDFDWPRGGWGYMHNAGWSDNSNTGYVVLGLDFAETATFGFQAIVPAFVKDELNFWIDFIQNDVNGDAEDGGSGYSHPDDWVNILKTGNLIYEMAFCGDEADHPRVVDAVDYIERHWYDNDPDPGFRQNHYQAMYTMMKGFERMGINTISVNGYDMNWFGEIASMIVSSQEDDGHWPWDYWGDEILATSWALLTLERVVPPRLVYVDIKPRSCPNPLNTKDKGVLPVAILGTDGLDVRTIDPGSVRLEGVAPLRWAFEDVATPFINGEYCGCTTEGADGYRDMTLKFDAQEIVATLGEVSDGETRPLYLTANLKEEFGGSHLEGFDCIIIKAKGKKFAKLAVEGDIPESFDLSPVYPNPFNPSTTIAYALPEESLVQLTIYNALGQKVTTLINGRQPAGWYQVRWHPQGIPSGFYVISFSAGDFRRTEKALYVK